MNVGALHKAVSIESAERSAGELRVTLYNHSDLPMKEVTLRVRGEGYWQETAVTDLAIAPGATGEARLALENADVRRVQVALSAWQADGEYYDNNGGSRTGYRIAPGLMTWRDAR